MVAFYYRLKVEIHAEVHGRVAVSMRENVGGVVRDRDLVANLRIPVDLSIKTQWNAVYVTSCLGCLTGANFPLLYMGT